jgi:hypothetical protein
VRADAKSAGDFSGALQDSEVKWRDPTAVVARLQNFLERKIIYSYAARKNSQE